MVLSLSFDSDLAGSTMSELCIPDEQFFRFGGIVAQNISVYRHGLWQTVELVPYVDPVRI